MAQIFVSHSKRDEELKNFFSKAFAPTNVRAIFEEFESIIRGRVTSQDIRRDIENSRAIFVVLSQNVQNIPHTRDWVVSEAGGGRNKDIWVFEPHPEFGRISVVTPFLRHYVIFDTNDIWLGYIRKIVESYDDSHVLPTALVTGGIGAAIGSAFAEDEIAGAFAGGILGAIAGSALADKSKERPAGVPVECSNCHSVYSVHVPVEMTAIRCPVCNKLLQKKEG